MKKKTRENRDRCPAQKSVRKRLTTIQIEEENEEVSSQKYTRSLSFESVLVGITRFLLVKQLKPIL